MKPFAEPRQVNNLLKLSIFAFSMLFTTFFDILLTETYRFNQQLSNINIKKAREQIAQILHTRKNAQQ